MILDQIIKEAKPHQRQQIAELIHKDLMYFAKAKETLTQTKWNVDLWRGMWASYIETLTEEVAIAEIAPLIEARLN